MSDPDARFWNRIAPRYARARLADEAAYQRKLEMTRALFGPGATVFELGCGTGSTALAHAPHAARIDAIDFSARMIGIARARAAASAASNIRFEVSAIEDWPAEPASYDMAMAHSVLHLVRDRPATLAALHRLVKPGGHFVSSTACLADFMGWFGVVAPLGRALRLLPRVSVFGAETLLGEIRAAGFDVVETWQPKRRATFFVIARKPEGAVSH